MEYDQWLLYFKGIRMRVKLHDWLHCIPSFPCDSSTVKVNFQGKQKSPELSAAESEPKNIFKP
jgi:hypothetical protein